MLIKDEQFVVGIVIEPGRGQPIAVLAGDWFAIDGGDGIAAEVAAIEEELALGESGWFEPERSFSVVRAE